MLVIVAAGVLSGLFMQPARPRASISITKLAQDIQLGNVKRITVEGANLSVAYLDGTEAVSTKVTREIGVEESLAS